MNKDNLRPVSNIRHGDRPGTLRIRARKSTANYVALLAPVAPGMLCRTVS